MREGLLSESTKILCMTKLILHPFSTIILLSSPSHYYLCPFPSQPLTPLYHMSFLQLTSLFTPPIPCSFKHESLFFRLHHLYTLPLYYYLLPPSHLLLLLLPLPLHSLKLPSSLYYPLLSNTVFSLSFLSFNPHPRFYTTSCLPNPNPLNLFP